MQTNLRHRYMRLGNKSGSFRKIIKGFIITYLNSQPSAKFLEGLNIPKVGLFKRCSSYNYL